MKYINRLIYIAAAFLALACTNEPVEIQHQVTVTVSPAEVLDGFVAYDAEDKSMSDDAEMGISKLRITALLYDQDGKLIEKKEGLLKDYNEDYKFSVLMDSQQSYTLLCFSSAIHGTLENVEYESYTFSDEQRISTLKVLQEGENSYYSNWSVLGSACTKLSSGSNNVDVKLAPATSFVYLRWCDIHANGDGASSTTDVTGTYSVTATSYFDDTYTWEIEVIQSGKDVTIKNLAPFFVEMGLTADIGYNTFTGYIEDGYIIVPQGQTVGWEYEGAPIKLYGIDRIEGTTIYIDDMRIKIESGKLIAENGLATYLDHAEGGWLDLFTSPVEFKSTSSNQPSTGYGVDDYAIIYHNNDVVTYKDGSGFEYKTTLNDSSINGRTISPADYPEAKNIYVYINLLPGEFDTFARTFIGNDMQDYSRHKIVVEAGKQYYLELDCKTMSLNLVPGTLKSMSMDADKVMDRKPFCINNAIPMYFSGVKFNGNLFE